MPTKTEVEAYDLRYGDCDRCLLPDGGELYYETRGTGEPLVLVNNVFLISPLWRSFTKRIAERRTLLTYDLRNQGASSRSAEEVPLQQHVADLEALLDHVGVERTEILGTSMSTLIARDFTAAHPDRVSGLILVGPSFSPFGPARLQLLTKAWFRTLQDRGPAGLFSHIYTEVFSDRTIENGGAAGYLALKERFLALHSPDQLAANLGTSIAAAEDPSTLEAISCPVQLIAGDGDFLASRSSLEEMARRLAGPATIDLIPFAGHVPFFDEPDAFEEAVCRWLES